MSELPRWARPILGSEGVERIETAIAEAESHTCGEIVPVLVRRSSTIGHVPVLALCLLWLLVLLPDLPGLQSEVAGSSLVWLLADLLVAAIAALGLARLDVVQRLLTPGLDRVRQVDLRAQVEFYRAMDIFYRKHFAAQTPWWLHSLIVSAVSMRLKLEQLRVALTAPGSR